MTFDLTNYSQAIQSILQPAEAGRRLMPLAPTGPFSNDGLERLRQASAEALFDAPPASGAFAHCVQSALYLYFSDLDGSHGISQKIDSTTGSFLHGIMHRQEPDYSNAKYWFRKIDSHPVYEDLRNDALHELPAGGNLGKAIDSRPLWDAFWMVDQCEAARQNGDQDRENELLLIQSLEWRLLFDYCYRQATGQ